MNREDCYKAYELMTIGMIEKNPDKLRDSMCEDAILGHMTGREESREEYIQDILNGTLNYYDYRIEKFEFNKGFANIYIKLQAKVYNSFVSWWDLAMKASFKEEDGKVKVKKCEVRMA